MADDLLRSLEAICGQAAFNRWGGFEVLEAEPGRVAHVDRRGSQRGQRVRGSLIRRRA